MAIIPNLNYLQAVILDKKLRACPSTALAMQKVKTEWHREKLLSRSCKFLCISASYLTMRHCWLIFYWENKKGPTRVRTGGLGRRDEDFLSTFLPFPSPGPSWALNCLWEREEANLPTRKCKILNHKIFTEKKDIQIYIDELLIRVVQHTDRWVFSCLGDITLID